MAILSGKYSYTSKRFTLMCRGKQSAAIAIVALAFRIIVDVAQWISSDLDKILDDGTQLYKKTLNQSNIRCREFVLAPDQILSNFFINDVKVIALAGKDVKEYFFENAKTLIKEIGGFLDEYGACIFTYEEKSFALWTCNSMGGVRFYFIFNICDADENGQPRVINCGSCCCCRFRTIEVLVDYMIPLFKKKCEMYRMYSMNILKIIKNNQITFEERNTSDCSLKPNSSEEEVQDKSEEIVEKSIKPVVFEQTADFCEHFAIVNSNRGILRGSSFIKQPLKIPTVNVCALLMLHHFRSSTWRKCTIDEILSLGLQFYEENSDVRNIKFCDQSYEIDSDQIVIGQIISKNDQICDLERGLKEFFKLFDSGLIQGPQNVAIWQEGGFYFMFDPKERDEYGMKFVKSTIKTENDENEGAACLIWFRDLFELTLMYIDNVPIQHRRDPFRLTKIEICYAEDKTDDYYEWKSVDCHKWIIRGSSSYHNKRFREENRGKQSLCMAIMANAFTELEPLANWTFKTIDKIMDYGDGLHSKSIAQIEKLQDEPLIGEVKPQITLTLADIVKEFSNLLYKIELKYEENVINGTVAENPDNASQLSLPSGLEKYFMESFLAILNISDMPIAIWKEDDYYYLFDPRSLDSKGVNPFLKESNKSNCMGTSCAMRFESLDKLTDQIIANLEVKPYIKYSIDRVEFMVFNENRRPELYYYANFGERGAILRPVEKGMHEGNMMFDLRRNRQTFCNLVVALAMTQINNSSKWSANCVNDILDIGDKTFCRILKKMGYNGDDTFEIKLDDLLKGIQIGVNQFDFAHELFGEGRFVDLPKAPIPVEISDSELTSVKDSFSLGSVAKRESKRRSRLSRLSGVSGTSEPASEPVATPEVSTTETNTSATSGPDITTTLMSELKRMDDLPQAFTILESGVMNVAIWKQDRLYYIFDPKASQDNTQFTEERLKLIKAKLGRRIPPLKIEPIIEEPEEEVETVVVEPPAWTKNRLSLSQLVSPKCELGKKEISPSASVSKSVLFSEDVKRTEVSSLVMDLIDVIDNGQSLEKEQPYVDPNEKTDKSRAYVAWFPSIAELHDHILSRIPEEYQYDEFKIRKINFTQIRNTCDQLEVPEKYHNFNYITSRHSIIRGTISQNDQIFLPYPNRNNQDTANCVTCLSFSLFSDSSDWSSTIIDVILKYGDRLYTRSIEFIKKMYPDIQFLDDPKIKLHHLATPFTITTMKFYLCVIPVLFDETKSVADNLEDFFTANKTGVICCRNYYVAIFKQDSKSEEPGNEYFMFDPHDIGPNGLRRVHGVACLSRFEDIQDLADVFLKNCEGNLLKDPVKIYNVSKPFYHS